MTVLLQVTRAGLQHKQGGCLVETDWGLLGAKGWDWQGRVHGRGGRDVVSRA